MSRLDNIQAYVEYKEELKNKAEQERIDKRNDYHARIKALAPRIKELVEVANACQKAKIALDHTGTNHNDYDHNFFISDGWSHLTGFIRRGQRYDESIIGVGKIGGGACYFNLIVDTNGDIIDESGSEILWAMESFLSKFDEFETKFYQYVDKKTAIDKI